MYSLARKVALCVAGIALAVLYAKSHFYRDPGSAFFDQKRANEERYSKHRRSEAQAVIGDYDLQQSGDDSAKAGHAPKLALAVSSVKRAHTSYLQTTVASILHGLTPEERADLHLTVFVAESDAESHPDWESPWLRNAVDELSTYNRTDVDMDHIQRWEQAGDYRHKGVFDYVQALQRCYNTGAPYIGLFEDDILLADGWLVRTLRGLNDIVTSEGEGQDWLFMRIFNQERSTGWAHREIGANYEMLIIIGIALGFILPTYLARWKWRSIRQYLDWETISVLVLLLNPALVVLFFQCGKASMLPPSPGVAKEPFGCCSQAMIYPRDQVRGLINYLNWMRRGQVDLLLKHHAKGEGLLRYNLYPVQAQHIGVDSARETIESEALAIWSMSFENLDARSLQREHRDMVREYYGELDIDS